MITNKEALTEVSFSDAVERRPLEDYPAARLNPESYPGDYPSDWGGFLVTNSDVIRINYDGQSFSPGAPDFKPSVKVGSTEVNLDEYLTSHGLSGLEERFPIIAYASNRSPGQLVDKFSDERLVSGEADRPDLKVIPAFQATLIGMDVVYNAFPGNFGYFYAELFEGPQTINTMLDITVLLLTWDQIKVMSKSESSYEFGDLTAVTARLGASLDDPDKGVEIPAYVYSGVTTIYAEEADGAKLPVALSEVEAIGRTLPSKDQLEIQKSYFDKDPQGTKKKAIEEISGYNSVELTPQNFIHYMEMERAGGVSTLDQRKKFKLLLREATLDEEQLRIDLRENHDFHRLSDKVPDLMTLAEIVIAHPRGQGWWHKIRH